MRNLTVFVFSMLIAFNGYTQNAESQVDEEAKAILDKVSTIYEKYETIKSGFEMVVELAESDEEEKQQGTFYLKGDSYKIVLDDTEIITDAVTQWTYMKEVEELQISDYEPEENGITPSEIFSIYKKDYTYFYSGKEDMDKIAYHTIDLTPQDKEQPYFKIRLWINVGDNHIEQAKVFDKNGNRYIYKISDFEPNVALEPNFFSFDVKKYENSEEIEIIDLR